MSTATELGGAFVHALEAEYEQRVVAYRDKGLEPDDAHLRAFEEVKQLGWEALRLLGSRGLFPWPDEVDAQPEGGADAE